MSTKSIALTTLICAALASTSALAESNNWLVRGRLIQIAPDVSTDGTLGTLGTTDVSKETTVELDFSYFATKNIALELILATTRHEVTLNNVSLGKLSHLPPTVTLQYHFSPDAVFRPYVGLGVNYTHFYDVGLPGFQIGGNSWGGAAQVGFDYALDKQFFLNVDVKKIKIGTEVKTAAGAKLGNLDIDPMIVGVGIGRRF